MTILAYRSGLGGTGSPAGTSNHKFSSSSVKSLVVSSTIFSLSPLSAVRSGAKVMFSPDVERRTLNLRVTFNFLFRYLPDEDSSSRSVLLQCGLTTDSSRAQQHLRVRLPSSKFQVTADSRTAGCRTRYIHPRHHESRITNQGSRIIDQGHARRLMRAFT
ncbi:hypothetical protein L227DRAFT_177859 [Lentinus tigrinus ALCF2SS1-6]|uniref:Uncharacterized protein n=1 Tax=Lentinus tigrinus ALCF2SS1-6 TaxID=1328759 RepID=A0A5C2S599_9APHY|nr:hypothetical protein L227DRAFT_177859 [Lentinus tigrinus ALCF2SS1-6]